MNKLEKIKEALKNALLEFARIPVDGGFELETNGEELVEGTEVSVYNPEGNKLETPDGEYTKDGQKITIVEGKVEKVEAIETETEKPITTDPAPETVEAGCEKKKIEAEEEIPAEEPKEDERDAKIKELEAAVAEKEAEIEKEKAEIEALKARIAELEAKPAAAPVQEEFAKTTEPTKTGNKGLDRLSRILNSELSY